jgi:hypothetical protein
MVSKLISSPRENYPESGRESRYSISRTNRLWRCFIPGGPGFFLNFCLRCPAHSRS